MKISRPVGLLVLAACFSIPESTGAQSVDTPTIASQVASPSTDAGASHFQKGRLIDAQRELRAVLEKDPVNVRAMLGLARLYRAISLHARALPLLKRAHEMAPNDVEVEKEWLATLPIKERAKELERYLAAASIDEENRNWLLGMRDYLNSLQALPKHDCELVTKTDSSEAKLRPLLHDANHISGWGLDATVNGKRMKLLLDTGAAGIVISRKQARKAGVREISPAISTGIGSKVDAHGFTAYAQTIRVGGLEFRDCVVQVIDARYVVNGDGLIGAVVFRDFLVDIDYPARTLRLGPLPALPANGQSGEFSSSDRGPSARADTGPTDEESGFASFERYIPAEMKDWTPAYRFNHLLLIPTRVNGSPPELFAVDTGAGQSMLSTEFARKVTKLDGSSQPEIRGVAGVVNEAYWTEQVSLEFSTLKQPNEECVAFDLSPISRRVGTRVAGILGISTLKAMEVKINYRDGLVDFVYDPERIPLETFAR